MSEAASRRRRGLGWALIVHGIAGLALTVGGLLFVASLGTVSSLTGSIEEQRVALSSWLGTTSRTLDDVSDAATGVDGSLGVTVAAAQEASLLTDELASTMHQLAAAVQIEILGSRPLGSLGADFTRVADRAAAVSANLTAASVAIEANRADTRVVAADFAELRVEIDRIRALVDSAGAVSEGADALGATRALLLALLLWLGFGATISLAAGLWLVRAPTPAPLSGLAD
jgi:hypothetical protein